MSYAAQRRVWRWRGLSIAEKLVLLRYAEAESAKGEAFPGVALVAADCGMTERGVRLVIAALREAGALVVVRAGGGRGRPTVYRVGAPRLAAAGGNARNPAPQTLNRVQGIGGGNPERDAPETLNRRSPESLKESKGARARTREGFATGALIVAARLARGEAVEAPEPDAVRAAVLALGVDPAALAARGLTVPEDLLRRAG